MMNCDTSRICLFVCLFVCFGLFVLVCLFWFVCFGLFVLVCLFWFVCFGLFGFVCWLVCLFVCLFVCSCLQYIEVCYNQASFLILTWWQW